MLKQKFNTNNFIKVLIQTLLVGLLLGSGSAETGPSSKETRFNSVVEMRDAFIEVGGICTNWKLSNVSLAIGSGSCSDASVLSIYSNRAVADEQNSSMKALMYKLFPDSVGEPIHLLVGENWILNDSNSVVLGEFQKEYGGDLITSYSQIP